jgi:hypothetical protein
MGKRGQVVEAECNIACAGNWDQLCGGSLRNSVYMTGVQGGLYLVLFLFVVIGLFSFECNSNKSSFYQVLIIIKIRCVLKYTYYYK